jgi:hypothetical protein
MLTVSVVEQFEPSFMVTEYVPAHKLVAEEELPPDGDHV